MGSGKLSPDIHQKQPLLGAVVNASSTTYQTTQDITKILVRNLARQERDWFAVHERPDLLSSQQFVVLTPFTPCLQWQVPAQTTVFGLVAYTFNTPTESESHIGYADVGPIPLGNTFAIL